MAVNKIMPSGSDLSAIGLSSSPLKSREVRDLSSPNPSDSEWFRLGVTVSPRFKGGSYA